MLSVNMAAVMTACLPVFLGGADRCQGGAERTLWPDVPLLGPDLALCFLLYSKRGHGATGCLGGPDHFLVYGNSARATVTHPAPEWVKDLKSCTPHVAGKELPVFPGS